MHQDLPHGRFKKLSFDRIQLRDWAEGHADYGKAREGNNFVHFNQEFVQALLECNDLDELTGFKTCIWLTISCIQNKICYIYSDVNIEDVHFPI